MGKLFGNNKRSLSTILHEVEIGTKLEDWHRRGLSRKAANLVVAKGDALGDEWSETNADRFFFAMYGVHPEYPRNKRDQRIATFHHELLDRFVSVGSNTIVADMTPPGSEPNPYRQIIEAGVPIRRHADKTPLRFRIERGRDWPKTRGSRKYSEYFRGTAYLPVSRYRQWDYRGELVASKDTGSIEVFSVGRDKSGKQTMTSILSNLLVGLDEIVAAHQFGQAEYFANDADFLGRMAMITSGMLTPGEEQPAEPTVILTTNEPLEQNP